MMLQILVGFLITAAVIGGVALLLWWGTKQLTHTPRDKQ